MVGLKLHLRQSITKYQSRNPSSIISIVKLLIVIPSGHLKDTASILISSTLGLVGIIYWICSQKVCIRSISIYQLVAERLILKWPRQTLPKPHLRLRKTTIMIDGSFTTLEKTKQGPAYSCHFLCFFFSLQGSKENFEFFASKQRKCK